MKKTNLIALAVAAIAITFAPVRFAIADSGSAMTVKACIKQAKQDQKNEVKEAKVQFKSSKKLAEANKKADEKEAKNLSGDERKAEMKLIKEAYVSQLSYYKEALKYTEDGAKTNFTEAKKACDPIKSMEQGSGKKALKEFILEKSAKLTQNYKATAHDGRVQYTVVYVTKKTLSENLSLYASHLQSKDWVTVSSVNNEGYKFIYATKGSNQEIQIAIDMNTVTQEKTVSISLTVTE